MNSQTPNLKLTLLYSNQSHKEKTINLNFMIIDFLLSGKVDDVVNEIPTNPSLSYSCIINNENDLNHNKLGVFLDEWNFFLPKNYMYITIKNFTYQFLNEKWNLIETNND